MQLITFYKLKKTLIWAGSLVSLATMAFGVFFYSQKLSRESNTAPTPSEASQNACYLEFEVPPLTEELSCVSLSASPLSGEAPLTVSFTATASNPDIVSLYRFDFGDGQVADETTPTTTHTYQNAGNYTASVQMQDAKGNWTAISEVCQATITVSSTPPEELACSSLVANPLSGDAPLLVSFTATASNPDLVSLYRFSFGDGVVVETEESALTHTYQEGGEYTASVQMQDAKGNWTPVTSVCQASITVTTTPPPPYPELVCLNLTANPLNGSYPLAVNFVATASDGSAVKAYRFIFGDEESVETTSATITHTYQKGGVYVASVQMRDAWGHWTAITDVCQVAITVTTPPPPPPGEFSCASLSASATSGQAPFAVTLTAQASDEGRAESYQFFFGDGESTTTTSNSVTHTYNDAGDYVAYVLIKDSLDGWTDKVSVCEVTISAQTPPPLPQDLVCNSVCDLANDRCPDDLACVGLGTENRCRNTSCSSNADCSCSEASQPTTPTNNPPAEEVEQLAQTPSKVVIPDTGFVGDTIKVLGAGLLLLIVGLAL